MILPGRADVDALAARLAAAGHQAVPDRNGLVAVDPSGNRTVIAAAGG